MRLKKDEINYICKSSLERMLKENIIEARAEREQILKEMIEIFTEELMVEDRLNEEVKNIMEKYRVEIQSGRIDYQKMFNMIKRQLIKERGIIL